MNSDEKACPSCAETIKAKAVRCRFCGHEMTLGVSPTANSPPAAPIRVDVRQPPSWLAVGGGLLLIVVLAMQLPASWFLDPESGSVPSVTESGLLPTIEPAPAPTMPRFDVAATAAAEKELSSWSRVREVVFDPQSAVEWHVGVHRRDGSSWVGYAESVCLELRARDLVDDRTDVRIVDYAMASRSGDWRAASLGHVDCETGKDLGV